MKHTDVTRPIPGLAGIGRRDPPCEVVRREPYDPCYGMPQKLVRELKRLLLPSDGLSRMNLEAIIRCYPEYRSRILDVLLQQEQAVPDTEELS